MSGDDIEAIIIKVTESINATKRRLTCNEGTCHSDPDSGDDQNRELKNRFSILKEVREKLEGLL